MGHFNESVPFGALRFHEVTQWVYPPLLWEEEVISNAVGHSSTDLP